MPYADPEKQREAQAKWYRQKYGDAAFALKEARRKAAWLQSKQGRLCKVASNARARAKKRSG